MFGHYFSLGYNRLTLAFIEHLRNIPDRQNK
jgi:hypothetical protein